MIVDIPGLALLRPTMSVQFLGCHFGCMCIPLYCIPNPLLIHRHPTQVIIIALTGGAYHNGSRRINSNFEDNTPLKPRVTNAQAF
jgi:hypothetical protein